MIRRSVVLWACALLVSAVLPLQYGCRGRTGGGADGAKSARTPKTGGGKTRPDIAGTLAATPDTGNAVADAVGRQATLNSLQGSAVIRMFDEPSRFKLGVNAEITANRQNGLLRIRAEKLAGAIQAFELFMAVPDVALYVPMEKVLYVGEVKDCDRLGLPIKPDEILDQLLRPDTELQLHQWRRVGNEGRNVVYENPDRQLRVHIDQRSGLLAMVEQRMPNGSVYLRKTLENYRTVDMMTGKTGRAPASGSGEWVYPFTQKIEWPGDARRVEIHFKRLTPNPPVKDSDFDFIVPPNVREQPLDNARLDSDTD